MITKIASPTILSPIGSTSSTGGATKTGMGTATKVVLLLAVGVGLYFGYTKIIKPMLDKRKAVKKED